jgi:subtilisin family serine protease
MWKITYHFCTTTLPPNPPDTNVYPGLNWDAGSAAATILADTGAQVINMSFGSQDAPDDVCVFQSDDAWCLALQHANNVGSVVVASSGNNRLRIQFPANDPRVVSVGGFDANLSFWDDSPGSTTFCPAQSTLECGSNYTTALGLPKQESIASAKVVLSTTYPGKNWNLQSCGDGFPGPGFGNGVGLCTGTSMSSPQVAGLIGILRSINPLVPPSQPVITAPQAPGVRTVLAQTTDRAQVGQAWDQRFGYGRPDAAAGAKRMLGRVAGAVVKNRATPLFRLRSTGANDYADTTTPQMAVAFIRFRASYQPQGTLVPGYGNFPQESGTTPLPAPRAPAYVLTTEFSPRPNYPNLIPLYAVGRERNWPVGCTAGAAGCNSNHRDFTLLTKTSEIEQAHTDGYSLRTIQGYIYQPCTPEPTCIPPGAVKFYRACNTSVDDCATFLQSEFATFQSAGYTAAYPAGSGTLMGYAYPSTDTDGDGLVDGFEFAVGTNHTLADTNGDFVSDGVQFPMAGVPVSDPCSGNAANCPGDTIFKNGFQL